jgi:hypothetical protein
MEKNDPHNPQVLEILTWERMMQANEEKEGKRAWATNNWRIRACTYLNNRCLAQPICIPIGGIR